MGVSIDELRWTRLADLKYKYIKGHLKGFYPASSFIKFPVADDS